jgi:membrane glycosyltransferase
MKMQPLHDSLRPDQAAASLCQVSSLRAMAPAWPRRAAFALPILGATALATVLAASLTAGLADPLRWPLLALLAVNVLYIALTGWPTVLGFLARLTGRSLQVSASPSGLSRTALVMPIHQEDPFAVFAAVEVMARAVNDAKLRNVDLFVLSDTQDPAIAAAEARAFTALRARSAAGCALHYRRRTSNTGRKVGNLAEFCATWGGSYDYMVVLDADSLMGVSAITTLIGLMDSNPGAGIVQTVPYPVGRETLFARIQQFSARLYTPMLVEGLTFWQQGDGNYWGHNAIVRIAPFVAHCQLPVLPGPEPFGGEILCHDVVEAGLMRAAGWDVWVLPQVMESYEALPANLVDFASRERRWCQGNLQHSGLLRHPGLRPVGRFHLGYGVLHYVSGPLAVLFLALATLDAALGGGFVPAVLLGGGAAHAALAVLVLGLLYGGKLLSLGAALLDPRVARSFGGRLPLLASAALEQLAALVISSLLIVFYTQYVAALLLGQTVRWDAQPRDDRGVSWVEGWMRLRSTLFAGIAWFLVLLQADTALLAWCAPLLFGLLLALPAAILSSRISIGSLARRLGLFFTPEELAPASILRAYSRAMAGSLVTERPHPALAGLQLAPSSADGD